MRHVRPRPRCFIHWRGMWFSLHGSSGHPFTGLFDNNPSKCHIWRQMIRSYRCKDTERLANSYRVRRFASVERVARRKLTQLDAAATLAFLRVPPGNRLEALRGERRGWYSIRINEQWRLCFRFSEGDAYDVEIVDCH